ncbi:beta-ketoacyl synthase chain length factor [Agriterribacter sp.]|uniref:beta-ketoacyl synthase chain length factor n=1 Tax=Agriterribacter sp. TaxID=2821509 RepID=UPI002BFFAEE8|nr:beta-ketoacyl synthase chain length factor [Agriterribacter sp.]HRO45201.1 beta-ketoacyl synthase chain length factor [Agriterribacter sp.]HRQ16804.1 beta-ketoacyl synthase chain length factor [Agriterribacter sp.]
MYIHHHTCISPQQTFRNADVEALQENTDNKLKAKEPVYDGIPPGILRRMGKAVRMGIGAAIPIIKQQSTDGIIIGTANGGMEDCIKFLNQIIAYDEGMLTPGNFVQSTPNAIAAQMGLLDKNRGYNITHVHRGLAFENALLDAMLMIRENPGNHYLLGAVDEISDYNYNIDLLDGCYKNEKISNKALYTTSSEGTIAGEGAVMFLVNNDAENALAKINAIQTLHTTDETEVRHALRQFMQQHFAPGQKADMLLTGENGDNRLLKYYTAAESLFDDHTTVARFKHMCGEYPTASSVALWLACYPQPLPPHMIKKQGSAAAVRNIIIYNSYRGLQHSFIHIVITHKK